MKTNKFILRSITVGTMACALVAFTHSAQAAQKFFLVKDGKAQSVIVAPNEPSAAMQRAIDELQYHNLRHLIPYKSTFRMSFRMGK